jgi:cephalosporin hydroxylase
MIIEEVKPDLIIEIGTYLGGGALYLADILDKIGNGVVHTIDIVNREYDQKVLNHPRIKMFSDGYQGYDLKSTTGFNKVMIVDDGSHVYIDVIEAFEKFKNLVNRDSYYIIEDGIVGYDEPNFYGGPHKAIMNIVSNNNEFFVDRRWCDFFGENATFNPDGYLKRK